MHGDARAGARRLVHLLAAALAGLVLIAAAPSAATATVSFRVGAPLRVHPVRPDFLGLALEYRSIPGFAGPLSGPVNPLFVQLLRNLAPTGRPVLRIGGQSGDRTWWPVAGLRQPLGITYDLSASWMAHARALAQALDAQLILGIGLEADVPRIDQVEAQELEAGIGQPYIDALELGNEPELYRVIPWYRMSGGHPVPWYDDWASPVYARGPGWSPRRFVADYARTARALPRLPLAGPSTGDLHLLDQFQHAFLAPGSQLRIITWHAYGLDNCVTDPSSAQYPSVPHLLSLQASRGWSAGIGPYVGLAHRDGASFDLDETGSISCNGHPGVSNSFASALWALDTLFTAASQGIDAVQLHTYPGLTNDLFDFQRSGASWSASVRPLYYGALMFAEAAPGGSHLLAVPSAAPGQIRAWAVRTSSGAVNVVLINDSPTRAAHVVVTVPGSTASATFERLRASGAYATTGVSLGGQSFGASTSTGVLGAPVTQPVGGGPGGYAVTVPAASAALLSVPG